MIERCRPDELEFTPLEEEMLLAHQRTRTSLFEVIEVQPAERLVRLRDLLEPERAEVRLSSLPWRAATPARPPSRPARCRTPICPKGWRVPIARIMK